MFANPMLPAANFHPFFLQVHKRILRHIDRLVHHRVLDNPGVPVPRRHILLPPHLVHLIYPADGTHLQPPVRQGHPVGRQLHVRQEVPGRHAGGGDLHLPVAGILSIKHVSYLAIGDRCVSGNEHEQFLSFSSSVAQPVLLRFFPNRSKLFRRGFSPTGCETDSLGEV